MEKIYYYNVGYYSYEDSKSEILINEKQYSKAEFDELVFECLLRLMKEEENLEVFNSFDNYVDDIIKILIDEHNFKELQDVIKFEPFGWGSLLDDSDWKHDSNEDLNFLRRRIKESGL